MQTQKTEYATADGIKAARQKLGLTQEQLAHLIGVTTPTFNRWERGHNKPSPLAMRRLREISATTKEPQTGEA